VTCKQHFPFQLFSGSSLSPNQDVTPPHVVADFSFSLLNPVFQHFFPFFVPRVGFGFCIWAATLSSFRLWMSQTSPSYTRFIWRGCSWPFSIFTRFLEHNLPSVSAAGYRFHQGTSWSLPSSLILFTSEVPNT